MSEEGEVFTDFDSFMQSLDLKPISCTSKSSIEINSPPPQPHGKSLSGDIWGLNHCQHPTSWLKYVSGKRIMNKRFTALMTTLILSVFFSISSFAYDVEVDGIYYVTPKKNVAIVTYGDKEYSGDITIPSSIKVNESEYTVKYIEGSAFANCSSLTSVTIPNSVTSIGDKTFYGCSSLTSVTIPNSVTSIGNKTFYGCSSLTSVTIPNSVTSIGDLAFDRCSSLTSVTIPNSVTSIGISAFYGCSSLTSVTIPNSVTSIGAGVFSDCSSLTSVTIPNSVTSIETGVFECCSSLSSITIPNSVTSIGERAFNRCSSLTSVTIPNSVTSIEQEAFSGCSSLTSVTIPNSVTSIEQEAFSGCSSLTSVTIPNSVTSIEQEAFSGCSNLTSITIPNSVTEIYKGAFAKCSYLENVYCYAEKIPYLGFNIFSGSYIKYATLHVPSSALSYYQTTEPWSGFGTIKALEGANVETKKCETPTISFVDGKLTFSCATEGVEYVSVVTCSDVNNYYSNEIVLAACYDITVTATKTGYFNSDVATAKLYWLKSSGSLEGAGINNVSMRGIAIQSAGGIINISGLDNNETVSFYGIDGKSLGSATAINGTTSFAAKSGSVVVAKIGKESIKIAVK